ncbi:T9SS type B sorting domain-containing protein [Flavobacterium subsaxonicum]|uniref:T9SS type B sorting domain-containing protein n=1 Tax=Flavobacterium subsaxonicum TaxID=426226 RepID=UPI000412DFD8|nr:T9SS type B sorting domain-containing protein [Flavobacterium subsaxonicum]
MKKITILVLLLLFCLKAFAQKEANNWYFGINAGIHFMEDGSVQNLGGSQMQTNEGCSSMSDVDGNLLFYSDGRNVWDRNHVLMPNANYGAGTGLLGDPSSTQSCIIIPNKTNPNLYYIFTVDEPHHANASVYPNQFTGDYMEANDVIQNVPEADDGYNNGLNYSIVDLSLTGSNGSFGDVTTAHNQQLYTYNPAIINEAKYKCSEKITAVKNSSGTGYWVVTHFIDRFYSFFVDGNGVNPTPVVTQITPIVPTEGYRRNAIGCIKASPDGKYIAIAHQQLGVVEGEYDTNGTLYLYNFDNATGVISNPVLIKSDCRPYGLEFSPTAKKLYVSYDNMFGFGGVHQYDMLSANISASDILVANTSGGATMQLGPNGKIYKAINGASALDVINNPEETGALCNYNEGAFALDSGKYAIFGLPPFITSFFSANIVATNLCLGQSTHFELNVSNPFDSVSWDFGDGSPAVTQDTPDHTFPAAGTYTIKATIFRTGETTVIEEKEITIYAMPVANTIPNMVGCDTDNNGAAPFTLLNGTPAMLGGQSPTTFEVRYFTTQADADANTNAITGSSYTNTSNPQTMYARVHTIANQECYATTSFQLDVTNTPVITGNTFALCDDTTDGSDTNGRTTFNLPDVTAQLFQGTGFTTNYFLTEAEATLQTNPLPATYYNIVPNVQTIYARIVNDAFAQCFSIQPVALTVNALPVDVQTATLVQCDTGTSPDGITQFNLTEADGYYTNGNADISVAYYRSAIEAIDATNAITGVFINSISPQSITARVTNGATGCYRILPLTLVVNVTTYAGATMERCDDDGVEDGRSQFNLPDAGFEALGTTVTYYTSYNKALMEENAIPANYFTTVANHQTVYARVEINNECSAIREIDLYVRPLPDIEVADTDVVCLNTNDFIPLDAGILGSQYSFEWSTGALTRSIMVNQPGVYSVTVTDNSHATLCQKVRTITVTPSNIAVINDVVVEDLRDVNTVTVFASPTGNVPTTYSYSLDNPNGPWQDSPFFNDVEPGVHTLYVYDNSGCGIVDQQVAVLAIPKFFTPNGDDSHDYWRVAGLNGSAYYNSTLFIYDRYGKLLSAVNPGGPGWDGTFNGHELPSTDYWFVLSLTDGRVVKGHFAMVR